MLNLLKNLNFSLIKYSLESAIVMSKNIKLALLIVMCSSCGLFNPANINRSKKMHPYPKATDDSAILYQLQSNKPRTHFFIDGKEMGVGRRLKVYINNQSHTITAQAEGCVGKEEFVQPPYNSIAPLGFTYLMGECGKNIPQNSTPSSTKVTVKITPTKTQVTVDIIPPVITITNLNQLRSLNSDTKNKTIKGKIIDDEGVFSLKINNKEIKINKNGRFSSSIVLKEGLNKIKIVALDINGNIAEKVLNLNRLSPIVVDKKIQDNIEISTEQKNINIGDTGKYFALVIGNNDYRFLDKLHTAVKDAEEVAKILESDYGFEIELLLNATRKQILDALNNFKLTLDPNDNFLIYYAGHGEKNKASAYWLPVNAENDSTTEWIQAATITTELNEFNSTHILIVSDSCYSGELLRNTSSINTNGSREFFLKRFLKKKSRTLIASGGNEPVLDGGGGGHSVFTKAFLNGLRNMTETSFTETELFNNHILESVVGNAKQTPQYGILRDSGHENGRFIFVKKLKEAD